jgi:hypothetical protein
VIFPSAISGEPFFELALAVFAQCPDQGLRKWDGPLGGAGLGLMQREFAIHALQGAPYGDSAAVDVDVDVGPFQAERLASAQPDAQRDRP